MVTMKGKGKRKEEFVPSVAGELSRLLKAPYFLSSFYRFPARGKKRGEKKKKGRGGGGGRGRLASDRFRNRSYCISVVINSATWWEKEGKKVRRSSRGTRLSVCDSVEHPCSMELEGGGKKKKERGSGRGGMGSTNFACWRLFHLTSWDEGEGDLERGKKKEEGAICLQRILFLLMRTPWGRGERKEK